MKVNNAVERFKVLAMLLIGRGMGGDPTEHTGRMKLSEGVEGWSGGNEKTGGRE